MLPCLLVPRVIHARVQSCRVAIRVSLEYRSFDRLSLLSLQVHQAQHAIIKAADQVHLALDFDHCAVAASCLTLEKLHLGQLTIRGFQKLLSSEDHNFAIHLVMTVTTCTRQEATLLLAVRKLFNRSNHAPFCLECFLRRLDCFHHF